MTIRPFEKRKPVLAQSERKRSYPLAYPLPVYKYLYRVSLLSGPGLGSRLSGLGSRVRVLRSRFRVSALGSGFGVSALGSGFWVSVPGFGPRFSLLVCSGSCCRHGPYLTIRRLKSVSRFWLKVSESVTTPLPTPLQLYKATSRFWFKACVSIATPHVCL